MATTLRADSFVEANIKERSSLGADVASAATTAQLETQQNIAVNDFLFVGTPGVEGCEKVKVSSLSGNAATMAAAFAFSHKRFDSVTAVFGDQIRFYRAANVDGTVPADGSFSLLATRDIDPDQQSTYYRDSAGSSDYWYKFTYYNSVTADETDLADSIAVRGDDYGHYASITEIKREAGFANNPNILDGDVDRHRRAAESEVDDKLHAYYTVPFSDPVSATVNHIVVQLAAGLLMLDQYNGVSPGGDKKVKEARDRLAELAAAGATAISEDGSSISTSIGVSSAPEDEDKGQFTMGMQF